MEMLNSYLINPETVALLVAYDSEGNEQTLVLEGKVSFYVSKKPLEIMNDTLKYFGSDVEGALTGAKAVLGEGYMLPICICAYQKMAWFSCSSFRKNGVMFSYLHVDKFERITKTETMVHTRYGHALPVPLSQNKLIYKRNQTAFLLNTLHERTTGKKLFFYERKSGITLCREPGDLQYRVMQEEE
ncbi:competence protein ComK [Bacillus massiliglaciei]|uniref:competence protein ComK n=1 Tax=Bacillus massiliglaciei TaxID=1816693 RepID=UPI000DA63674|nr:competence protein ComK [Bacillus massiliglaciei]